MKAYIAVSYRKRKLMSNVLNAITSALNDFNITSFIFVDHYSFDLKNERQMMQQAMADIDSSDLLIAETSDKGIGIGIETGYAKAKQKPVIYVRQKEAAHSTTVSGISDFQIVYEGCDDLQQQLADIINKIINVSN